MPAASSLTSLSDRLKWIVGELRAKVATRGGRDRAMVKLLTLAWLRLGRIAARFEVLMARLIAGTPFAPCRPRVRAARVVDRPEGTLRLPREWFWLVHLVQETAQLRGHVELLLADPEMAALLAATPRAGRILGPLCHMLGIEPEPGLALSVPGKPAPRPRVVKPPKAPPPIDEATAISLVWAALRAQGLVETPEPVRRRPWRGVDFSR